MDTEYWEVYDDQDPEDFETFSYCDRAGNVITCPINPDTFYSDIEEVYRVFGSRTEIKVHRSAA